jgi:hypothetical protein
MKENTPVSPPAARGLVVILSSALDRDRKEGIK